MHTVLSKMTGPSGACSLCGVSEAVEVSRHDRRGKPLLTVLCRGCGLVYNKPVPSDAEMQAFYSDQYRVAYKGAAQPRARQIARNFKRVERFFRQHWPILRRARTCLDVGSGSGEFLFFASACDIKARGIEPNKAYAAFCREALDVDVETGFIQNSDIETGNFDLIRLNHVMEHLNDPVASLRTLSDWLSSEGVIYIEVPNIEEYADDKSRGNIFHFGHIFNFNPWTLRACAGLAGLEEVEELRQTNADSTGTFFRKGRAWDRHAAINPDNAARVAHKLDLHYRERRILRSLRKLIRKLRARLPELRLSLSGLAPREIGDHFVAAFDKWRLPAA